MVGAHAMARALATLHLARRARDAGEVDGGYRRKSDQHEQNSGEALPQESPRERRGHFPEETARSASEHSYSFNCMSG